jgi:hypothetical protein
MPHETPKKQPHQTPAWLNRPVRSCIDAHVLDTLFEHYYLLIAYLKCLLISACKVLVKSHGKVYMTSCIWDDLSGFRCVYPSAS